MAVTCYNQGRIQGGGLTPPPPDDFLYNPRGELLGPCAAVK